MATDVINNFLGYFIHLGRRNRAVLESLTGRPIWDRKTKNAYIVVK
jgi:hypothetical protein